MAQRDGDMVETGTGTAIVALARPLRPTLAQSTPEASFLSQLIAERHRLPPQRSRRRAPLTEAVSAYATGSHITDVRLPAGYRRTLVA